MRRALRAPLVGAATLTVIETFAVDAAAQPACTTPKTMCAGHSGYYAPSEDLERLTAVADPILRDVRAILDGIGAKHVASVLVIRWDSEGKPVDVRIDVPGYEGLPCVQKAHAKVAMLENPRETAIRCELGCPPPPKPAPAPAPIVVAPPAPTTAPAPAPQPAPAPAPAPVPAPARAPEGPRYEKVWYGYQTLIADGLSLALLTGGVVAKASEPIVAGYVGFVLASPIVHMAHGNVGPGFGSIGTRLFVPWIGAGIGAITGLIVGGTSGSGAVADFGSRANGALNGAVIGTVIGVVGCIAIDAAGLAYTKERVDDANVSLAPRPPQPTFTLAPSFDLRSDRASVGVVGRF